MEEAEELHLQVRDVRLRVLGAEHPDTLLAMGNLAWMHLNQGRRKEAEDLLMGVGDDRRIRFVYPRLARS